MNLRQPQLPSGNGCAQHSILKPALSDNLLEQMLTPANLRQAWKRVKVNKGKPGVDGVTIEAFPAYFKQHWESIHQQLRAVTYKPSAVRRIRIPNRMEASVCWVFPRSWIVLSSKPYYKC